MPYKFYFKLKSGFSLIELMIVVAIIGVLAAIAIPAYGDYIIRARAVEMLTAISGVQTSLAEYRSTKGTFAATDGATISFTELGSQDPATTSDKISSVVVFSPTAATAATISVCGNATNLGIAGNTGSDAYLNLYFVGTWQNNGLKWSCEYTGSSRYIPTNCRTNYTGTKKCGEA